MGDYFCPNCNSDLKYQCGFDPEQDYWECSVCGKVLTNPDDDFSSEVIWYCDDCGACLNKQTLYLEENNYWDCTECGCRNYINENNIYESRFEYEHHKFNEEYAACNCENLRRCKECGKILNNQSNYYEWFTSCQCEKCGTYNSWSNDEVDSDNENDDCYWTIKDDAGYSGENYSYKSRNKRTVNAGLADSPFIDLIKVSLKFVQKVWFKIIHKKYVIGISSYACHGQDYNSIEYMLRQKGFYKFDINAIYDLPINRKEESKTIIKGEVNGSSIFAANDEFPFNARIVINYHMLKCVIPPISERRAKKCNVNELAKLFREAGFENVEMHAVPDLTLGVLNKEMSVIDVLINGWNKYDERKLYRIDSKIVIKYHVYKKKMLKKL